MGVAISHWLLAFSQEDDNKSIYNPNLSALPSYRQFFKLISQKEKE